MARGIYTVPFEKSTFSQTGPSTLVYGTCLQGLPVEILSIRIAGMDSIVAQQLRLQVARITGFSTSPTSTSITQKPTEKGDQAGGSVWACFVTAGEPTYGDVLWEDGFNTVGGFDWKATDREHWWIDATQPPASPTTLTGWGIRLMVTPASFGIAGTVTIRELG